MSLLRDVFLGLHPSWKEQVKEELSSSYLSLLSRFLEDERKKFNIFPEKKMIFNALNLTPFEKVKVVILGQDPYHGPGQAHGLSFSVPRGVSPPPSLLNIFKELEADLQVSRPKHGNLTSWARQGVLLLNATLTVREKTPKSHYKKGWEAFTDVLIKKLCLSQRNLVFLLWGNSAKEKTSLIEKFSSGSCLILNSAHPSPFSAHRFLGCRHFSKANDYLKSKGLSQINWELS